MVSVAVDIVLFVGAFDEISDQEVTVIPAKVMKHYGGHMLSRINLQKQVACIVCRTTKKKKISAEGGMTVRKCTYACVRCGCVRVGVCACVNVH